jgi:ubiquinone biosynthesis UbiH/UbiF/VisC/COQ6 family hydroxylase
LQIVIAGAGPVGLLFAFRLARRWPEQLSIRLLDAGRARPWQADAVDARVYALSRESQLLLEELWAGMVARRVSPYRRMCVFEGAAPDTRAAVEFRAADIGEPDLGHIVEDRLLRTVLLETVLSLGVEIDFGLGVADLERQGQRCRLTLADGTTVVADLVVAADGTQSKLRALAGIEAISKDYAQRAVVTHVASSKPHRETAWQRFLPQGPLALLPLADGRSSIVWTVGSADAERLLALPDAGFLAELEAASAGILGRLGPCSERLSFPLALRHAVRYTRPGVALIGDAAHAVHPLAGQGMNLGLRDAAVLADTLAEALARGEYPGDERVLRRYTRAQQALNVTMQLAFDGINELYGRRAPAWLAPLRAVSMAAIDGCPPAKRLLMRRALGLDRPAVARGAA